MSSSFSYQSADGLITIQIGRPPHNVLNIPLMVELAAAIDEAARDETAKALMITGAGKMFCAGVDVADHTPDKARLMIETFHAMLSKIQSFPVPTIAAVNGGAMGGGCELAIACDMIVAQKGAKIGQPEIKLGVFPPFAATVLPKIIPPTKATELLLGGGLLSADEALAIGLVNRVFAAESFAADCRAFADQFLTLSRVALVYSKRAIREASGRAYHDAMVHLENIYLDELMATADAQEGLNSFMEKRKPVWTNK